MQAPTHPIWSSQTSFRISAAVTAALLLLVMAVAPASATHPEVSLPGSDFEIDTDANTQQDDPDPSEDWLTADPVLVVDDRPSGQGDDSFGQGSKEDTPVPTVTDGSIPPNKSDLLEFGIYQEDEVGGAGFLHLFWSRVQDPSGTTNMDFEFNENKCEVVGGTPTPDSTCSSNGVTPVRTVGDLLITYDLARGGTEPQLSLREWNGTVWGPETDLDASDLAAGSINDPSSVPAGTTVGGDVLGPYDPRTFGEASIDLDAIFDPNACESFGSAYLKSRSSDSFDAAMKDFIAPEPVNLANCGSIAVEKVDDADQPLEGATFQLFDDNAPTGGLEPGAEDLDANGDLIPALDPDGNPYTCTTDATGTCSIDDVLFGSYWLDETVVPDGHNKASDLPAAVTIDSTTTVTVGPFVNPRQTGSILVAKVDQDGNPLDGAAFALDDDGDPATTGDQTPIPAVDGQTGLFCIDGLLFGDYNVVETVVPDGYTAETLVQTATVGTESSCADRTGDPIDTPDLTFENIRNPGAILITKTAKDVSSGTGSSPLAGVEFTVTDSSDVEVTGSPVTTDANGQACIDGLVVGDTYTVSETAVPTGFLVDPSVTQDVTITDDAICGDGFGDEDTAGPFSNDPLSEIEVTFRSLAQNSDGQDRTAATIDCTGLTATPEDSTPTDFDDSTETFTDLKEGTYTCTVVIDP